MQTFMTRPSYGATGSDLDNVRLGKQMTESMQIFDHLTGVSPDFYPNHPVMGMWRGYEFALGIYTMMLNLEWVFRRGFADHKAFMFFYDAMKGMKEDDPEFYYETPPWLNDVPFLLSHRSNLMRKAPHLYEGKWKNCPDNWPYIWPQVDDEGGYNLFISRADKLRIKRGERRMPPKSVLAEVVNWP
jgi:hypothetical protein